MARRFNHKTLLASGLLFTLLLPVVNAGATSATDVLAQPSAMTRQASHAVLLAVTRAGDRLVAVGERGVLLLSDDNGGQWRQVQVPVSVTLTAVQFVDARQGWAIGHSGVVLHSADGGESWALQLDGRQAAALELAAAQAAAKASPQEAAQRRLASAERLVADGPDKPWLALQFSDARHGLVVGAYGLALATRDGGRTWTSWMGRIPNAQGLHLYAVGQAGGTFYLAGEQGLLLRSRDDGESFEALPSPYEGSYFSLALQADGALLVGGLRGKLFRSRDQGEHFEPLDNPVPVSLGAATRVGAQVYWVNQAGGLLRSDEASARVQPLPAPPGPPLIAVTPAADGSLVGVGFAGTARLPMPVADALSRSPAHVAVE